MLCFIGIIAAGELNPWGLNG